MLRKILVPAVLAFPIWFYAMIMMVRNTPPDLSDLDFVGWVVGVLFNLIGILLVCLPAARPIGILAISFPLKSMLFVATGAVGGFCILATLALIASTLNQHDPFDLQTSLFGVLGLLPGAITAALWLTINYDIFRPSKDASVA